ncbi:small subunit ribosomal protein YMR-31 [Entomortierella parvispora]|uniref:Small subunit ribosomal protein YMR-31 n=1 Tax=Entomortierella parvispora TaxID=205924 RepID=A0A9P3HIU5_9FUNG|nr:small subunit ribosomal protein YMR-31 [Entomortierella parvispora]
MLPSTVRLAAIARTPLIKFVGPRSALNEAHHEATRHPAAPKDASYPLKAGIPVKATPFSSSSKPATQGPNGTSRLVLDFTELPARYRHPQLTEAEIEAVETGGATAIF